MTYLKNIGNRAGKITTPNEPFYFNMITRLSESRSLLAIQSAPDYVNPDYVNFSSKISPCDSVMLILLFTLPRLY